MTYKLKEVETIFVNVTENKVKKSFNEKIGAFSVLIDNVRAANDIIDRALKLGLTAPKMEVEVKEGQSSLAFFFDSKYDIDYVHTKIESKIRNLVPVYSAKNDKYTIIGLLREAAERKKQIRTLLNVRGYSLRDLTILKKEYKKNVKQQKGLIDLLTTKAKSVASKITETYIEVSNNYVQIGTKFYKKGPNDIIVVQ